MMSDEDKYALDQASKEVEHSRSWPTKLMAFFVAINFGVVAGFTAMLSAKVPLLVSSRQALLFDAALALLAAWVVWILIRNHTNYLTYRDVQVSIQSRVFPPGAAREDLPAAWFSGSATSPFSRWWGYGLYVYMVLLVTGLTITAVDGVIGSVQTPTATATTTPARTPQ